MDLPDGSVVKNPPAKAGDVGSIPGSGRAAGEGNGNPLQYSCLENFKDREAWRATVYRGHKESDTTEHTHTHTGHKRNILSNTAVTNYFQTDFWTVLKMGNRGEVGDKRSNNSFLFFAELLRLPALVF